jgi:hypothetical protein
LLRERDYSQKTEQNRRWDIFHTLYVNINYSQKTIDIPTHRSWNIIDGQTSNESNSKEIITYTNSKSHKLYISAPRDLKVRRVELISIIGYLVFTNDKIPNK